jgi:hypothetical protein
MGKNMKKELLDIMASIKLKLNELESKINLIEETKTVIAAPQPAPQPAPDVLLTLNNLVSLEQWTEAVPSDLICDETNHEDKMDRARGVRDIFHPNFPFEGKKILDFGTGYGHLVEAITERNPAFVVGYDIKNEFQIENKSNSLLTTSWDDVVNNGPYDLIYLYDVIDHVEKEGVYDAMSKVKSVLADNGIIKMRCHPFISRHGGHTYTKINKSYAHLVFTKNELALLGHDLKNYPTQKVIYPVKTYRGILAGSGLKMLSENIVTEPAEQFFLEGEIAERIKTNLGISNLLIPQMGMQFLDYTASK